MSDFSKRTKIHNNFKQPGVPDKLSEYDNYYNFPVMGKFTWLFLKQELLEIMICRRTNYMFCSRFLG